LFVIKNGTNQKFIITKDGQVTIGSPTGNEDSMLNVKGVITATQVKGAVYNDY
jgi:hypothetical protein